MQQECYEFRCVFAAAANELWGIEKEYERKWARWRRAEASIQTVSENVKLDSQDSWWQYVQ